MGDMTFWAIVRRRAEAPHPLVVLPPSGTNTPTAERRAHLTDAGRDVLQARAEHVDLNGIDRWMGGVHLTDGRYRWDGTDLLNGR